MKRLIICLAITAIVSSHYRYGQGLWFNTHDTQFKKKRNDWYTLQVPCQGGSGDYDYTYYDVPAGWEEDESSQSLLVPSDYKQGRYQVKVLAYDIKLRVDITRYLIVELDGNDINVFSREEFDSSFNIDFDYQTQDREFYEYPSWEKIISLIRQGDAKQIRGIIRKTIDSDNPCDEKQSFFNGILNRIERFIATYEQQISSLESQTQELSHKNKQLSLQYRQLYKQRKNSNTEELEQKYENLQNWIAWQERKVKQYRHDIQQYESYNQKIQKKIWDIKQNKIPNLQQQVKKLKDKIEDDEWESKRYSSAWRTYGYYYWSYGQTAKINDQIQRKQRQIYQYKSSIKQYQSKISWVQKKIKSLQKYLNPEQQKLNKYKQRAVKLKKELSTANKQQIQLEKRLKQIQKKTKSIENKIYWNQVQGKKIKKTRNRLQEYLQEYRMSSSKHILQCQDIKIDFSQIINRNFVIVFNYNIYEKYVQKNYGFSPTGNIRKEQVELVKVNTYSKLWTKSYGYPFKGKFDSYHGFGDNNIINIIKSNPQAFEEKSDDVFTCSIEQGSYKGRITQIQKNLIHVVSQGKDYVLKIGDCSTMETSTGAEIPKIGDNIYWKGALGLAQNSFNLHSGLAYQ